MEHRVIFYHKQATSARTRFLRFANNSVCAFDALPELARVIDDVPETTPLHQNEVLSSAAQEIGLKPEELVAESEFQQLVEVPGRQIRVVLAAIKTTDPPFELAESIDAKFIDLTQARSLPPVELQLLRSAYEVVLGG